MTLEAPSDTDIAVRRLDIEAAEMRLLGLPQLDIPITHRFAPGIYWREMTAPKDAIIIGHRHKTKHFNLLLKGRLKVLVNGRVQILSAPFVVVSEPGERKVARVIEEAVWVNIHPTEETDLQKLEDALIEKSDGFIEHELRSEVEALRLAPDVVELEVIT